MLGEEPELKNPRSLLFVHLLLPSQVYPAEYVGHYMARDGIGIFIDYYNHRRPHQSLDYVTPYDMLIGRGEEVIQQRKKKHITTQQRRKEVNKQMADYSRLASRNPVFP